jgi:cobyrinic acid a,c-diamide synthase
MMNSPRLVIAGLGGDSGKTVVSLGLLLLARERGLSPAAFKKGPDYIDAAWLTWAAGRPARNLDTYLMGPEEASASFRRHAASGCLSLVEGNRGLYDGADAQGTHSTAELAKLLDAPVALVVNATKVTRTVAALVLGCQRMDPGVRLGGVVLNQVSGRRHESVMRRAVEETCGIPVLGVLPRAAGDLLLPGRHLGLVTPQEHPGVAQARDNLLALVRPGLDWEALLNLAQSAPRLEAAPLAESPPPAPARSVRIGFVRDSAFTFYYPENLEALEALGAQLVPVSALEEACLPENLHALYIGGGFPETHGASLSANRSFLASLRRAARAGLPVYAECGGLMLLCRSLLWEGKRHEMAGVLPFDVEVCPRPQGHGYADLEVDAPNPFFSVGTVLRGHEFHYSRLVDSPSPPSTACKVLRGAGAFRGRDGLVQGSVWASYTHLHHLGSPAWSRGLVEAAARRREEGDGHGTTM